jgi:ribosomal protein S2
MTKKLAQMLRVKRTKINLSLGGVLEMKGSVKCKVVDFLVVTKIAIRHTHTHIHTLRRRIA